MSVTRHYDVAIIGAGAAGLMCAKTAGERGRRVLLLDHGPAAGAKILISGGGRCNFTNLYVSPENFISDNPHFCKSALVGYTQHDFITLVAGAGIAYHEKRLGQLFCDGPARQILDLLLAQCAAVHVDLRFGHKVTEIFKADLFRLETDHGGFKADDLVLATGGLSIPKMGATGFAHDMARRFGLPLTEIRPGLVPLTMGGDGWAWIQGLSGVSFETVAAIAGQSFREQALFTHRGLSGPAILQISSYWREGGSLTLDMLPAEDAYEFLLARKTSRAKAELKTILSEILPARLAHNLLQPPFANQVIGTMTNAALAKVASRINSFSITPAGSEGYAKAEVTLGGIDTAALSSKTMEAREVPGLYVIGEAMDVTGWLGGYNFQWAWSSGYAAGRSVR